MSSRMHSLLVSGIVTAIVLAGAFAQAGTISFNYFTDDAGSGISHLKTYTHLYDGGQSSEVYPGKLATVDGVQFNLLTHGNSGTHPLFLEAADGKFRCETFKPAGTNQTGYNSTDGEIVHGIDPTQGVYNLMRDLLVPWYYNDKQIYTVRGLTPGTEYDLRLYYARWKENPVRNITFNFDANGDGAFDILNGDDTTGVVNTDAGDGTYSTYLSYKYTAPLSGVMMVEIIHGDNVAGFAMCGLTNEEAVPEPSTLALLAAGLVGLLAYAWRKRM